MAAKITFFQVGNGDMTLVRLADFRVTTILIDTHIRALADDPNDDTPDVATALRKRIMYDSKDRPFVDAFLLSHPDQDHCGGLRKHFWLGHPDDYPDDHLSRWERRIIIRELWSSPLIFRRRSRLHTLSEDASAFNKEARRRVKHWQDHGSIGIDSGNRILIMGEDINGKTDALGPILIKSGEKFNWIDGEHSAFFTAHLLAPAPHDEELESELSKNESSVIMNIELSPSLFSDKKARFLTGGDAEVLIWDRMWARFEESPQTLEYDLLLAPHHCSWHTLSYDSWSQKGEEVQVCEAARNALGQARSGATIISSSKKIIDDPVDPPCIRAKREYDEILDAVDGWFSCTGDLKDEAVLEFEVTKDGKIIPAIVAVALAGTAATSAAAVPAPRAGRSKK